MKNNCQVQVRRLSELQKSSARETKEATAKTKKMYGDKLKLLAYFAFALCFNLVCTTNGTQMIQHSIHRHNVHQHHHNQQRNQHQFSPNSKLLHAMHKFFESRFWYNFETFSKQNCTKSTRHTILCIRRKRKQI